jgi:hypothetical protein
MTHSQFFVWNTKDRASFLRRFATFVVLYWVAYIGGLFFSVCLGRSFSDDLLILGGSSVYVVCIGAIALLFRAKTLVGLTLIAMLTSMAFRLIALLPYYSETTPSALAENTFMHAALALLAAIIAFPSVSFLFRRETTAENQQTAV